MTNCGIYITGDDRVIAAAVALLNSIRCFDATTPVILIPYSKSCQQLSQIMTAHYGMEIFPDLSLIERIHSMINRYFGSKFFARPNQFRKLACWFGPFDQFLYLDTDIVVFEKIAVLLDYLEDYDFICCDYQYYTGLTNVFTPEVLAAPDAGATFGGYF